MAELQAWNASNDQNDEIAKNINWMILEGEDRVARSPSLSSSYLNNDDADDFRYGSCGSSNGPLYELSDLLLQLPIKGLSKYYQGKSQSFRNLRKVENINDFAKKMSRKKTVRSNVKSYTSTPKAIIYKESTSCYSFCKKMKMT